jgi:capsid protein
MVRRIRAGTSSRSEEASQMGRDPESLEREIAADNKRADELDLVFDSDPRRVARSGTYQETGTTEQEQGNG